MIKYIDLIEIPSCVNTDVISYDNIEIAFGQTLGAITATAVVPIVKIRTVGIMGEDTPDFSITAGGEIVDKVKGIISDKNKPAEQINKELRNLAMSIILDNFKANIDDFFEFISEIRFYAEVKGRKEVQSAIRNALEIV